MGRPIGGGDGSVVSAASATGSYVAVPSHATGFWVHASAGAFIDVRFSDDDTDDLTDLNAAPLAAATLYGPFSLQGGVDKFIVVAGAGGTATVTITFVT